MGWLIWTGVTGLLLVLVLSSAVIVPKVHSGVVLRFNARPKKGARVLHEGLHFLIPFIETVELFSYELVTLDVDETFFTSDRLEVRMKGSVQWRPDRELLKDVFIGGSEEAITNGLRDTIKSELGKVAGTKDGNTFITDREAVDLLINALLRLGAPFLPELTPEHRFDQCCPPKEKSSASSRAAEIKVLLAVESERIQDRSEVEKLFGIDIMRFSLADVGFSKAVTEAFERKKEAEAKREAAKAKLGVIGQYREVGLEPREALAAAEVSLGEGTQRKVFSLEGLSGLRGMVA